MRIAELKQCLENLGLSTDGKKLILRTRLQSHLLKISEDDEDQNHDEESSEENTEDSEEEEEKYKPRRSRRPFHHRQDEAGAAKFTIRD